MAGEICFGAGDPLYTEYHNTEWGRPLRSERGLYERLCLEAFQSGLAWITILRKRPGFRAAFAGFDPEVVARFGPADVDRLLGDAAIVRHRGKIDAAIANARATLALRAAGTALPEVIWAHRPQRERLPARTWAQVPATTPESILLAKTLRRAGFRFVGPTTAYALMQACGLVNDHLAKCPVRAAVEAERQASRG